MKKKAYIKVVCNKLENEKVLGMHYLGQNAGEVMQGFAVAIEKGITKGDLDKSVGIHPTTAEEFCMLSTTKRSGESPERTSC